VPQFLLPLEKIEGNTFVLSGPEAFHVTRVLRMKEGQTIELFDGRGGRYNGVIRKILMDGSVEGDIADKLSSPEPQFAVTLRLFLGIVKPSHFEWAIEKGTEIGIASFHPVITPRTIVQSREISPTKITRWNKIITAAAKQSKRATLPKLESPVHYRDAIVDVTKTGLTLVGWPKEPGRSTHAGLKEVLAKAKQEFKKEEKLTVNLFIGPEGGFSAEEIELAGVEGAHLFSLGSNTLRTETAAAVSAAIVFYELGAF
jgi:16S rRNA (uracil1498-N3)-methyltransferase